MNPTSLDVLFKYTGSGWEVTAVHDTSELATATWTAFDITFGFYYGIHTKKCYDIDDLHIFQGWACSGWQ